MIPKKIHYCWFGRNPKPKLALRCIKSWEKNCPDYEIIEWNEDNFDISSAPLYVQQAYEAKKWAFVTDYVRLKVVYDNGGLYFDTDVEVIKSFDVLLSFNAFFGFENELNVNTGLGFGAEKSSKILSELLNQYKNIAFYLPNGGYDSKTCPERNTEVFIANGLVQNGKTQLLQNNVQVLASEYLCPINYSTEKKKITPNTLSIHWFNASWFSEEDKKRHRTIIKQNQKYRRDCMKDRIKHLPHRIMKGALGEKKYNKLKTKIKKRS